MGIYPFDLPVSMPTTKPTLPLRAAIANASFMTHYPLQDRYPQPNPKADSSAVASGRACECGGSSSRRSYLSVTTSATMTRPPGCTRRSPHFLVTISAAAFRWPGRLIRILPTALPRRWSMPISTPPRTISLSLVIRELAISIHARLTVRPDSKLPSGLELWRAHNQRYLRSLGDDDYRLRARWGCGEFNCRGIVGLSNIQPRRLWCALRLARATATNRRSNHLSRIMTCPIHRRLPPRSSRRSPQGNQRQPVSYGPEVFSNRPLGTPRYHRFCESNTQMPQSKWSIPTHFLDWPPTQNDASEHHRGQLSLSFALRQSSSTFLFPTNSLKTTLIIFFLMGTYR